MVPSEATSTAVTAGHFDIEIDVAWLEAQVKAGKAKKVNIKPTSEGNVDRYTFADTGRSVLLLASVPPSTTAVSVLLYRRIFDPRIRYTSHPTDIAVLLILWVQLTVGLITLPYSLQHADGSVMLILADWAQRIVTLRPVDATALAALLSGRFSLPSDARVGVLVCGANTDPAKVVS